MFKVNDYIMYGMTGVCQVVDITKESFIDNLQKEQDKLIKQVSYLMKATDEATRKEMLAQMGIEDESVDLNTYIKSLRQDLSEVINIDKNLKAYLKNNTTLNIDNSLLDAEEIIRGINFEQ